MTRDLQVALEQNIQAADNVIKTSQRLDTVLCFRCGPARLRLLRLSNRLRTVLAIG